MTYKNNDVQRLTIDKKRQADHAVRGFDYQFWLTVLAWLKLDVGGVIVVEGAEDFDEGYKDRVRAVQVKDKQDEIRLTQKEAVIAIGNYLNHVSKNAGLNIYFTYLTTAKAGVEPKSTVSDNQSGIEVWNTCHQSKTLNDSLLDDLSKLPEFLNRPITTYLKGKENKSEQTDKVGHEELVIGMVNEFLSCSDLQMFLKAIVKNFNWDVNHLDKKGITEEVEKILFSLSLNWGVEPNAFKRVADTLRRWVGEAATGENDRELTRELLNKILGDFVGDITGSATPVIATERKLRSSKGHLFCHDQIIPDDFVGREQERMDLAQWVEGEGGTIVLNAVGGIGKSTLARYWVERDLLRLNLSHDDSVIDVNLAPKSVFWWSFYQEDADFNAFFDRLYDWIVGGDAAKEHPTVKLGAIVKALLTENHLIVLDGFEKELRVSDQDHDPLAALNENECLNPLAGELLRIIGNESLSSHMLITTRLMPKELMTGATVTSRRISGLKDDEVLKLFGTHGFKGNNLRLLNVSSRFGHHPLALKLLIQRMQDKSSDIEQVSDWTPSGAMFGDTNNILNCVWDDFDKEEKEILCYVALNDGKIGQTFFKETTGIAEKLANLAMKGAITYDQRFAYISHPIVMNYVCNRIERPQVYHEHIASFIFADPGTAKNAAAKVDYLFHKYRSEAFQDSFDYLGKNLQEIYYDNALYRELLNAIEPGFEDDGISTIGLENTNHLMTVKANCLGRYGALEKAIDIHKRTLLLDSQSDDMMNPVMTKFNIIEKSLAIGNLEAAWEYLLEFEYKLPFIYEVLHHWERQIGFRFHGYMSRYLSLIGEDGTAHAQKMIDEYSDENSEKSMGYNYLLSAFVAINSKKGMKRAAFHGLKFAREANTTRELVRAKVGYIHFIFSSGDFPKNEDLLREKLDEALLGARLGEQIELELECLVMKARFFSKIEDWQQCFSIAMHTARKARAIGMNFIQADCHILIARYFKLFGEVNKFSFHLSRAKHLSHFGSKLSYAKAVEEIVTLTDGEPRFEKP